MLRSKAVQQWCRTLHIYISMSLLLVVVFFAVTGITLNRPELFVGKPSHSQSELNLPSALLDINALRATAGQAQLIEHLRTEAQLKGLASPLAIFTEIEAGQLLEGEVSVDFKGPGYDASVYIDLLAQQAQISITDYGNIAWLNDLHKGRNVGESWHGFIDASALLMVLFVLTGVLLLVPKKRTFKTATWWTLAGSSATALLYLASV